MFIEKSGIKHCSSFVPCIVKDCLFRMFRSVPNPAFGWRCQFMALFQLPGLPLVFASQPRWAIHLLVRFMFFPSATNLGCPGPNSSQNGRIRGSVGRAEVRKHCAASMGRRKEWQQLVDSVESFHVCEVLERRRKLFVCVVSYCCFYPRKPQDAWNWELKWDSWIGNMV